MRINSHQGEQTKSGLKGVQTLTFCGSYVPGNEDVTQDTLGGAVEGKKRKSHVSSASDSNHTALISVQLASRKHFHFNLVSILYLIIKSLNTPKKMLLESNNEIQL